MGTGASPLLRGAAELLRVVAGTVRPALVPGTHVPGTTTGQLPRMGWRALEELASCGSAALSQGLTGDEGRMPQFPRT